MKKAFTLVEIIAVLVILSIIVLISIPIVNSIIDKSKISANKRNIENYAHAIELAQAEYRLEHGFYTYDVNNLNIKYTGKEVICDEIALNENGSVYVNKCKIDGIYIEDLKSDTGYYSCGSIISDYKIGDEVTYNGIDFYVVKNSSKSDKYVTLLKKTPIKSVEVVDIIEGTEIYNKVDLNHTYLEMQYYYHDQCRSMDNISDGCSNDYSISAVKQVIDGWGQKYLNTNDLLADKNGYNYRLISNEDFNNMVYTKMNSNGSVGYYSALEEVSILFKNSSTFTMIPYEDSSVSIFRIGSSGASEIMACFNGYLRPVITLKKSAIEE